MTGVSGEKSKSDPLRIDGFVDFFGFSNAAGGWFFCGWSADIWPSRTGAVKAIVHFERSTPVTDALICWHERPDLDQGRLGFILYVPGQSRMPGELIAVDIGGDTSGTKVRTIPVRPIQHLRESELTARTISLVSSAFGDAEARGRIFTLLTRRSFAGQDTLSDLPVPIHMEIDEAILAGDQGVVLIGWGLDPTGSVAATRVRTAHSTSVPIERHKVRTLRHDVIEAVGIKYGVTDPYCGFVAFAPLAVHPGDLLFIEVELQDGAIGYRRIPQPTSRGIPAIRRILESVIFDPDNLEFVLDNVVGPPCLALNKARLSAPRESTVVQFGTAPSEPVCSIIVPLYGRIDFLLYQMAFFSESDCSRHEFIYVLDDPPQKTALLTLARSVFNRFGIPFTVVCMAQNLGFAPANNVGLGYARGQYICFLNSDVMPAAPEWVDLMVADLQGDPRVGIVGALLEFEDGTVQHQGMSFERLPDFANWSFPYHPGKGRLRTRTEDRPYAVQAVTGACMVMNADLAKDLGGFDENYAIGDFEDSDLCLKVRAHGLSCIVDPRARLWHLERQSQAGARHSWRMYLTLLNAWVHTRRWGPALEELT